MGLDFAHFLLDIEEKFNVDLFAHDFFKINTLEDFITLLEEETAKSPHSQAEADILFQEKFLAVQNFFAEKLAIDISHLTPETQIAPLLRPLSRRRRIWKKLRKEISPNIPPLYGKQYNGCLGFMSVCIAVSIVFVFVLSAMLNSLGIVLPMVFYSIVVGCIFGLLVCFPVLFSTIPTGCDSLGGITRHIVRKISLDSEGKVWTRETITDAVLRLASEQTGIPKEKISLTEDVNKVFG